MVLVKGDAICKQRERRLEMMPSGHEAILLYEYSTVIEGTMPHYAKELQRYIAEGFPDSETIACEVWCAEQVMREEKGKARP
jgi:hypothetical protein